MQELRPQLVLAVEGHKQVVNLIQTCKFSIIMDGTTDIAVVKQTCLLACLFGSVSKEIRTLFYKIMEVPKFNADAGTLFNVINSNFSADNISFDNLHNWIWLQWCISNEGEV